MPPPEVPAPPRRRTPILRRLLALTAAAAAASSLALGPAGSATAAEPDPLLGAPAVGSCYDVTLRQIAAASLPAGSEVPCTSRHTLRTSAVVTVDEDVDLTSPGPVYRASDAGCDAGEAEVLGGSVRLRSLDTYSGAVFVPTATERESGARWISCHVLKYGGDRLLPLPTTGDPTDLRLGRAPLPDDRAGCRDADFRLTACDRAHRWRLTGVVDLGERWQGRSATVQKALDGCPRVTTSRRFHYAVPSTKLLFALSPRLAVCSSRDSG